jgi:hypothetical protein
MYLVAWEENDARLEASLGGRVTVDEMAAFADDVRNLLEEVGEKPYLVLIDYCKAKEFDFEASAVLASLKDFCLASGAALVVSLVQDDETVVRHTSERLQLVLEGREMFLTEFDESQLHMAVRSCMSERRLAA